MRSAGSEPPAHVLFAGRPDRCGEPDFDVLNGPERYPVVAQTIDHLEPRAVDAQARPPLGCVNKPGKQNQPGCSVYRGIEISGNQQPRQRSGGAYPDACGHRPGRCRPVRFGWPHRRPFGCSVVVGVVRLFGCPSEWANTLETRRGLSYKTAASGEGKGAMSPRTRTCFRSRRRLAPSRNRYGRNPQPRQQE